MWSPLELVRIWEFWNRWASFLPCFRLCVGKTEHCRFLQGRRRSRCLSNSITSLCWRTGEFSLVRSLTKCFMLPSENRVRCAVDDPLSIRTNPFPCRFKEYKEQHFVYISAVFICAYLYKQTFAIPGSFFLVRSSPIKVRWPAIAITNIIT